MRFGSPGITQYRQSVGHKTAVLPDFFIGAHAAAGHRPLLTRDDRRYRTYFPSLKVIAPDCERLPYRRRP